MEQAARTMKSGRFFVAFCAQGKQIAEFVLLDRNPLDVPKEELRNRKVPGTYFAGRRFVRKKRSVAAVLFAAASRRRCRLGPCICFGDADKTPHF